MTMKFGIEVEGLLKGIGTIFISADEYIAKAATGELHEAMNARKCNHLYISDHGNRIEYKEVGELFASHTITLEVTNVFGNRPNNVKVMLSLPQMFWTDVSQLNHDDQVKVDSPDRHVLCMPRSAMIATMPEDFAGDIEL